MYIRVVCGAELAFFARKFPEFEICDQRIKFVVVVVSVSSFAPFFFSFLFLLVLFIFFFFTFTPFPICFSSPNTFNFFLQTNIFSCYAQFS